MKITLTPSPTPKATAADLEPGDLFLLPDTKGVYLKLPPAQDPQKVHALYFSPDPSEWPLTTTVEPKWHVIPLEQDGEWKVRERK